ncbi:IPT/TIG domain-containing protein [Cryptosporangium sp. NPDC051539]|uniref:IPT/TIG domain-containing protein n=1 Tax=Cryptosporangium sp. NPDC051539 TaxID=3363962 RepID=UPI0037A8A382
MTFDRAPATGLRPPQLTAATALAPRATANADPAIASLTPGRGPSAGGTAVTIAGSNLGGADTTIVICGARVAAGAVQVNSTGTSLTFTAPKCTSGTSVVHVITNSGVATSQYTYGGTAGTLDSDATRQVSATTALPRTTLASTSPGNLAAGVIGALLLVAGIVARQAVRRGPSRSPLRRLGKHALPHDPQVIGLNWSPDLDHALHLRGH